MNDILSSYWAIEQERKLGIFLLNMYVGVYLVIYDPSMNELWVTRGRIFSCVWPSYEWAVSDLDRFMKISL